MTVVDVLGHVDELADGTGGSVDVVTGAAIGPYRKSQFNASKGGAAMLGRTRVLVAILGLAAVLFVSSGIALARPIRQLYIVTNSGVVPFEQNGLVEVSCAAGDFVTGGGFETDPAAGATSGRYQNVVDNKPSSTSSWLVAISLGPGEGPITLTVYAVCAR